MRQIAVYIALMVSLCAYAAQTISVPCGSWIELQATGLPDYHFVQWSDGDTNAVRQVEVLSEANYIAYFAPNCGDYASLPVIKLYDWLLMLDVKSIREMGYYFSDADVVWYRVRGTPDAQEDASSSDDEQLQVGYYLTIDQSFAGTGDYYALVDMSASPAGVLCHDRMRSVLVHYTSAAAPPRQEPILEPTYVLPGEQQVLSRLDASLPVQVYVYDMTGKLVKQVSGQGQERILLYAGHTAGCYQVVVVVGNERYVLRYLVCQ